MTVGVLRKAEDVCVEWLFSVTSKEEAAGF
jgi:hypothetical protein